MSGADVHMIAVMGDLERRFGVTWMTDDQIAEAQAKRHDMTPSEWVNMFAKRLDLRTMEGQPDWDGNIRPIEGEDVQKGGSE